VGLGHGSRIERHLLQPTLRSRLLTPLLWLAGSLTAIGFGRVIRKLLGQRRPGPPPIPPPTQTILHGQWRRQDPLSASPQDRASTSRWANLKKILDSQSAILAVLGLLVYVMVHGAYDAFYHDLGITPDEVGMTYILIIARAGLGFVAYVVLLTIIVLALTLLMRFVRRNDKLMPRDLLPKDKNSYYARYALFAVAALLIFFLYFLGSSTIYYLFRRSLTMRIFSILLLVLIVALLIYLWKYGVPRLSNQGRQRQVGTASPGPSTSPDAESYPRFKRVVDSFRTTIRGLIGPAGLALLIASLVVLALGMFHLSAAWGHHRAKMVQDGEEISSSPLYGIIGVRASPVCISWIGSQTPPIDEAHQVIYLGQSGSTAVLYDSETDSVRRIPSSNVMITSREVKSDCRAVTATTPPSPTNPPPNTNPPSPTNPPPNTNPPSPTNPPPNTNPPSPTNPPPNTNPPPPTNPPPNACSTTTCPTTTTTCPTTTTTTTCPTTTTTTTTTTCPTTRDGGGGDDEDRDDGGSDGPLPYTGQEYVPLIVAALLFLFIGAIALVVGRRARSRPNHP
jgi:hypothetical protein